MLPNNLGIFTGEIPGYAAETQVNYRFEAQDIVSIGWKYNDPNSFITISI